MRDSWKIFWRGQHKKKFFMYLVPFQVAMYVSSPFVTPYMLAQMKMNYGQYMGAIAALMVGKILSLSLVQYVKKDLNGFRMLVTGVVMISPLPALWALSESYEYVLLLQIVSGMSLACFEVGLSLIFFKDLKQEEKVPVLTMYNLLNSVAIIGGTFLGGFLLRNLGEEKSSYWTLYIVGAVLRIAFCIPLVKQSLRWRRISDAAPAELQKAS
jgi:MFS family permease